MSGAIAPKMKKNVTALGLIVQINVDIPAEISVPLYDRIS